jgi:HK97 family phage prohead protease
MADFEIRGGIPAKIRADAEGLRVEGYAAVFGQETDIGGMFREVIERGAFTDAIGRDDVVFLINHEGLPLARTRSGTLRLSEDDHGLKIETMLDPDDPDVKSISGKMKRGDLDKMSFAFYPEVQEWDEGGDTPLRTIKRAALADVSIVTTPAYGGTEIALRSMQASRGATVTATEFRARQKLRLIRQQRLPLLAEIALRQGASEKEPS